MILCCSGLATNTTFVIWPCPDDENLRNEESETFRYLSMKSKQWEIEQVGRPWVKLATSQSNVATRAETG